MKTPKQRKETLEFLREKFLIPDNDTVTNLSQRHDMMLYVVVYMDNGESELIRLVDAFHKYPENFAVLYVGHNRATAESSRMVQIGIQSYWFEYSSMYDWRSTIKPEVVYTKSSYGYHPLIHLPLFSIDFIDNEEVYAIDFDVIPSLRHTGLDTILSTKGAVNLIKQAKLHYNTWE